ncbi:M42 family metallopeptidase [Mammaliicoccus stepanovicii]|uniref:Peptidase n=1 Tax=Mammaliicoccus stepanovicii TaxID=643214 RepID=A0A240A6T9_9STAP|nr:M42 family metallopeptidase [Mammaliicoccus stepanovicii]PNZ78049.1 peptidase M28 [Mammaliicoccus stepanovicii]GGI39569.1 peptidase M28 [Mammaliicoccus stepanovicii]SNV78678.1 peptidase [Mammaliicoccus stepanovicii]
MADSVKLLKTLTDINGISGFEFFVKEKMREYLEPVSDEIIEDNLGGIFGKRNADNGSKTLLIAGHLDEIGFIVTRIDDDGFIKFTPIGGWWNQVMLSQKMTITTDEGKTYRGIIGSKPPHVLGQEERKKQVEMKDMFIDLGVDNKEAVEALGIEIGNMITPYSEFEELGDGNYLTAKAFDNRFGCALSVDVLNQLKDESLGINLVSGATVQEEVGLRGAKVAANKIKPDLSIAVDVGIAYDTPGMKGQDHDTKLGDGPLVLLMDGTNIGHVGFRKFIKKLAKEKNIDLQWDNITGGGTDAGSIHVANEGTPTISIGIPLRYMHSNVSVIHKQDYLKTVNLVAEIVKALNDDTVKEIMW